MLRVVELIEKKRERKTLEPQEIRTLFQRFLAGQVPEYQMSALLMAIYFQGMEPHELVSWTREMIGSGLALNFDHLSAPTVDKHSTGGVGDKISLPLAPLLPPRSGHILPGKRWLPVRILSSHSFHF